MVLPKVLWNWYHQHDRVFDWQHICYLCWTCFSTDLWVQTVPLFSPTCSFIRMRHFTQGLLKKNEKKLARPFHFTFRYIDDVLSLNNSRFGDFVGRINPIELEITHTTDTDTSASYLDLHLEIHSDGRLRTKPYDKGDDFNFPIVNLPFICSNIPAAPPYYDIRELMVPIRISLIEGCCHQGSYWTKGSS